MASTANSTSKVFVGSIPGSVEEDEIRAEMAKYGTIQSFFHMTDHNGTRGWCFVTYSGRNEAICAINAIDGKFKFPCMAENDKPLEARFAFVKSPPAHTQQVITPATPITQAGCPWLQYFTPEGHPYYYNSLTLATQWERPINFIDSASLGLPHTHAHAHAHKVVNPAMASATYGPQGSNLFIFHIPADWADVDLVQHFQHFGSILSARCQRDHEGKNRGYGFVSFDNTISAYNAIKGMNGFSVGGKFLKVQLKKGDETHAHGSFNPNVMAAAVTGAAVMHHPGGVMPPQQPVVPVRYSPY